MKFFCTCIFLRLVLLSAVFLVYLSLKYIELSWENGSLSLSLPIINLVPTKFLLKVFKGSYQFVLWVIRYKKGILRIFLNSNLDQTCQSDHIDWLAQVPTWSHIWGPRTLYLNRISSLYLMSREYEIIANFIKSYF